MAKGFKINGIDFDDLFHAPVSGIGTATFTGLNPTCTYTKRVSGSNPNAAGYWKYNGVAYDAQSINEELWEYIPLTLQARGAGNISITKKNDPGTIYYSKNGGSQTVLDSGVNISVNTGDRVSFYRTLSNNLGDSKYFTINCTNNCYVYGNIMSLYNRNNFSNLTTIQYEYAFYNLFNRNSYIDINESVGKLVLPATTLAQDCYEYMFNRCTSLTTAPTLPATTLANACYYDMFNYCTNLTTPPSILPATTLAEECYSSMFSHCTSLTTAPTLPATTLADYCYYAMFRGCSSLTTAPSILPATTLANACYESMFRNCSSLTTAPTLPATTLVSYCYEQIFSYCTSLTTITCLATNISAYGCTSAWVGDVASSGTFYKNSAMSSWTTGTNGIPSGWTVRNA